MKLLGSNPWRGGRISRFFGSLFNSSESLTSSSSSTPQFEPLYRRIFRSGNPSVSILPVLHQWLEEGRELKQTDLQFFIKKLRVYNCHRQALQISEWMGTQMRYDLQPTDITMRLHLISKVHGPEEAEKYFDTIPKLPQMYGALVSCYAEHKSIEKAEAAFEKMKGLGFLRGPFTYNAMLTLYSRMGKRDKVDFLFQEMENNGIPYNIYTYNIRLYSYAAASDIGRMEKLLMKMEADPLVVVEWQGYVVAADAFVKVGRVEMASTLLRRAEQLVKYKPKKVPYEYLMSSYADIGKKDEVYRIWGKYKNAVGFYNNGYWRMIDSLVKMDDIDGAEKVLEEWECGQNLYDILIPNLLIKAYCKKGLLEKAKSYALKISEKGKEEGTAWALLATGYHMNGQMAEAVETLTRAAKSTCRPGWKIDQLTLAACLEYLKEKGDLDGAVELLMLFKEKGHISTDLCDTIEHSLQGRD